jgi:D-alanyl-D-alanine carboxypeptidase
LLLFIKEYYFKYPEIFDQTIIPDSNTNIIVNQLSFLNGGKTGYTSLSGGNLFVSIQKGLNRQIFIIVLNSTEKNRFVDVQNIANFLLQSSI